MVSPDKKEGNQNYPYIYEGLYSVFDLGAIRQIETEGDVTIRIIAEAGQEYTVRGSNIGLFPTTQKLLVVVDQVRLEITSSKIGREAFLQRLTELRDAEQQTRITT